jgi:gas vesicle protein
MRKAPEMRWQGIWVIWDSRINKNTETMSEKSNSNAATAMISFLTGAAAGAVAGVLFAPDKGARTREKIAEKTRQVRDDVNDDVNKKVDDLKSHISDFVDEMKNKINDLEKDMKTKAEEAKNSAASKVEKKAKEAQS